MAYAKSSGVPVPVPVETVNGAHYCKETLTVKGSGRVVAYDGPNGSFFISILLQNSEF